MLAVIAWKVPLSWHVRLLTFYAEGEVDAILLSRFRTLDPTRDVAGSCLGMGRTKFVNRIAEVRASDSHYSSFHFPFHYPLCNAKIYSLTLINPLKSQKLGYGTQGFRVYYFTVPKPATPTASFLQPKGLVKAGGTRRLHGFGELSWLSGG